MSLLKSYALSGLSLRGIHQFVLPLMGKADAARVNVSAHGQLVGIFEPDSVRSLQFQKLHPTAPRCFDSLSTLLAETAPDTLIVTGPDYTHADQIIFALESGCEVIAEKPMVISSSEAQRVLAAERATGKKVRVGFNMRYSLLHRTIKKLISAGRIGRITNIEFSYNLDTFHGASYFRRWNRRREFSGGLSIHKCCHHLDLIQWWANSRPSRVFSFGALNYYGPKGANRPASSNNEAAACPYHRRWNPDDEFDADRLSNGGLSYPMQYPKPLSIYDDEIDIEDTYASAILYESGAMLSYSCNFSAAWEGYTLGINGTLGRIETRFYCAPNRCPFPTPATQELRIFSLFGENEILHLSHGEGGHGGADAEILRDIFIEPSAECRELNLAAGTLEGAYAVAAGEALWKSCQTGEAISIEPFAERDRAQERDKRPAFAL